MHNKVSNRLINVVEKAAERINLSETSQFMIVQPNVAIVYQNQSISKDPLGLGARGNQKGLTQNDIVTIYSNGDKSSSFDTLLYLPPEQANFQSGYKLRTYFIIYRTNILFLTNNQTLGNLSSNVIAASVKARQIHKLTQPVVIKFEPKTKTHVSDNESINCVTWNKYLDGNRGGWSTEGCSYEGRDNEYIICHCR